MTLPNRKTSAYLAGRYAALTKLGNLDPRFMNRAFTGSMLGSLAGGLYGGVVDPLNSRLDSAVHAAQKGGILGLGAGALHHLGATRYGDDYLRTMTDKLKATVRKPQPQPQPKPKPKPKTSVPTGRAPGEPF